LELANSIYPSCGAGPVFVSETTTYTKEINYGANFTGYVQGGYTVDGVYIDNTAVTFNATNGTVTNVTN